MWHVLALLEYHHQGVLVWLKLCPSNWSIMKGTLTHSLTNTVTMSHIMDQFDPHIFNSLMSELNPSEQCCLLRFFTGDFKCYCLLLEKKNLIDFSFKINEIKFCTLFMNWLIRQKMLTYFYNIFRPVNRVHCMKCGVNSSLLT